jgi:hypothetical protein
LTVFDRFNFAIYKEKEMADFRRSIPVLAVLALLVGSAVTVSAQTPTLQCFANAAVPPIVRAEGLTELVGDFLLNCTGGVATPAGLAIPQVNIQVFMNTSITSRLLADPWSEALLMLDEPLPAAQFPCETSGGVCSALGNGSGAPIYYGGGTSGTDGNNKNVFQGRQAGSNSILWLGVPFDAPGTSGTRVVRITNIRANANALGVAGTNAIPTPLIMSISATGSTSVPINNPQQTVGFIQKGLGFSVRNAVDDSTLSGPVNSQQCFTTCGRIATLRYSEQFATAFKVRYGNTTTIAPLASQNQNAPGAIYNTESGFVNQTWVGNTSRGTLANAGNADWGTRLKAVFTNVPAGIALYVDNISVGTASNIAYATGGEFNAFNAVSTVSSSSPPCGGVVGTVAVSLSGGTGSAVWEILQADPLAIGRVSFGLYVSYTANPGANSPALGAATVNGSYAPISTVTSASASNIPRFADTSTGNNIFSINPCVTNLLFPFVTNQVGFDTGLAISSTSTDPFGTSPQSGTCTLNWYGANAPSATTTPTVTSGTTYTTLASVAAPNFQGYMIAVCRFQYAHGFAFVSDLGARNLAMGYLALVIPDPARSPSPLGTYPVGSGEILGQ